MTSERNQLVPWVVRLKRNDARVLSQVQALAPPLLFSSNPYSVASLVLRSSPVLISQEVTWPLQAL